jgi:hypothetical protein
VLFQDRKFQILRGRLSFFNPSSTEPYLDFRVETFVKDYRVTITLSGLATQLKPQISSSPPLPPEDVLALLTLGEAYKRQYRTETSSQLSTASLLSFTLTEGAQRRAEKLFSLDRFRLDPFLLGSSAEMTARLTIGKKLSRDFYIYYSTNLTRQPKIVRWSGLSNEFSIVGTRNEIGRLSLDIKVRSSFRTGAEAACRLSLLRRRLLRSCRPLSPKPSALCQVEVWVDGLPNTENLERLISIRPGDPYSLFAVSESIKQIYRSRLFSDVEVIRSGEDRVELRFLLTRRLTVRKIDFRGEVSGRQLQELPVRIAGICLFLRGQDRSVGRRAENGLEQRRLLSTSNQGGDEKGAGGGSGRRCFHHRGGSAVRHLRYPDRGKRRSSRSRPEEGDEDKGGRPLQPQPARPGSGQPPDTACQVGHPRAEVELSAEDFFPENGTVSC